MTNKEYTVLFADLSPELQGRWDGVVWKNASPQDIDYFRPEGSTHHSQTLCKLLYDADKLYGIFRVDDQFINPDSLWNHHPYNQKENSQESRQ